MFLGSLATANRLAPPGRRSHVVSTFFAACYCGLIIPVIGVGVASQFISDFAAVLAFSILGPMTGPRYLLRTSSGSGGRTSVM